MTESQVVQLQLTGGMPGNEMIVGRQVVPDAQAAVRNADPHRPGLPESPTNPGRRIVHGCLAEDRAREQEYSRADLDEIRLSEQPHGSHRLLVPRRPVPDTAGQQRVMVARQYIDRHGQVIEHLEGTLSGQTVHGRVVEQIAGNEHEINFELPRLAAKHCPGR